MTDEEELILAAALVGAAWLFLPSLHAGTQPGGIAPGQPNVNPAGGAGPSSRDNSPERNAARDIISAVPLGGTLFDIAEAAFGGKTRNTVGQYHGADGKLYDVVDLKMPVAGDFPGSGLLAQARQGEGQSEVRIHASQASGGKVTYAYVPKTALRTGGHTVDAASLRSASGSYIVSAHRALGKGVSQ